MFNLCLLDLKFVLADDLFEVSKENRNCF